MGGGEAVKVIAGVGMRRGCAAEEVVALVRRASVETGCAVTALAAPAFKREQAAAAAASLGVALVLVEQAALEAAQALCPTRSEAALRAVGVASVAEGSALAAAGAGARLVLARIASGGATCALAESAP